MRAAVPDGQTKREEVKFAIHAEDDYLQRYKTARRAPIAQREEQKKRQDKQGVLFTLRGEEKKVKEPRSSN